MRLFRRRRDDEPVHMDERSPQLGLRYKDLAVLGQLASGGADLTEQRQLVYYLYATSAATARDVAASAEAARYSATVREPLDEFPGRWVVICERRAVASPDVVRDADDFFQGLADRHSAEFDGWEASF